MQDSFLFFSSQKIKKINFIKNGKFWVNHLKLNPYLHDKIEFDIADSCYDFFFRKKN